MSDQTNNATTTTTAAPAPTIKPTVGRIVNYFPDVASDRVDPQSGKAQPYPAIITHVWGDTVVNLSVFNDGSFPLKNDALTPTSVGMTDGVNLSGRCWQWMPFQTGQAAKVEDGIKPLQKAMCVALERIDALENKPAVTIGGVGAIVESIRTLAACEHKDVQSKVKELIGE